jgi:hypothetical protein
MEADSEQDLTCPRRSKENPCPCSLQSRFDRRDAVGIVTYQVALRLVSINWVWIATDRRS